jgi:hypothetical protein
LQLVLKDYFELGFFSLAHILCTTGAITTTLGKATTKAIPHDVSHLISKLSIKPRFIKVNTNDIIPDMKRAIKKGK